MDFIDLAAQQKGIKDKIDLNIQTVLGHGKYIMGPEVTELERRLSDYVGAKHAVGCASGTDALLMALMAFNIGPGDAIFTTPFTFIATAEVISLLGATPIFVDIDPKTYNIDPEKLEEAINAVKSANASIYPLPFIGDGQTSLVPRGIIPVDLFGLPADYDRICAIAEEHGLFVVEDAAQSFGAEYKGKKSCSFGNIACTSFFPAKPLGCYGDGGMCFTDDDALMETLKSIRVHGQGLDKYNNVRVGINGRLDTLQAAILLAKFDIFPGEVDLRQMVARRYSDLLAKNTGLSSPCIPDGYMSAWAQYSILSRNEDGRQQILNRLQKAGVPTAIYYPKPLHLQEAFQYLEYGEGDFPHSEDCANRIFSVPMHPYLDEARQEKIVTAMVK
ncbi:MAG: DegT/DnrJ/EryC1/StrS family aminotransferase [Syntrophales bacterium]|nr:DegT/DnrJ/EryC1/StrS family aminotransferase [Syntrophales bacterium]